MKFPYDLKDISNLEAGGNENFPFSPSPLSPLPPFIFLLFFFLLLSFPFFLQKQFA